MTAAQFKEIPGSFRDYVRPQFNDDSTWVRVRIRVRVMVRVRVRVMVRVRVRVRVRFRNVGV